MKKVKRRKCLHCCELFDPDRRNVRHQKYCSKADCRKAGKAASQRRWLEKQENRNYFRGPSNVQRVQEWRRAHPGYWRSKRTQSGVALQEDSCAQAVERSKETEDLAGTALQDLLSNQAIVLAGLIANLIGSSLQEDIARTTRQLLMLGCDILNCEGGQDGDETPVVPGTGPPIAKPVQLGGSAIGSG